MDALLSALPVHLVSTIVKKFFDARKDELVIRNMIQIAANRISGGSNRDIALKQALTLLLSVLDEVIKQEVPASSAIALAAVGQLSLAHGKLELTAFESILPTIVQHGMASKESDIKRHAISCLVLML